MISDKIKEANKYLPMIDRASFMEFVTETELGRFYLSLVIQGATVKILEFDSLDKAEEYSKRFLEATQGLIAEVLVYYEKQIQIIMDEADDVTGR